MASTAGGMARMQLKQFVPKAGMTAAASCSYSTVSRVAHVTRSNNAELRLNPATNLETRHFSCSTAIRSSWPAGSHDEPPCNLNLTSTSKAKGKATITCIPSPPRSKTIADIQSLKASNIPIVCITAHDYPSALSIRSAPVDLCLIGDSLANVALGHTSTQPLSLDAMIHHSQAVKRGLDAPLFLAAHLLDGIDLPQSPLVIADMPFGSTFGSIDSAVASVVKLIQQTGVDGVKIEGSYEIIPLIQRLTHHGIPVMGHLGLQPQRVGSTSGYRVQAKTASSAKDILDASHALEKAGCFSIVLECIPTRIGEYISTHLEIPTIGIGAGSKTDGQILVMNDMLGDLTGAGHVLAALSQTTTEAKAEAKLPKSSQLTPAPPKFVRNFCPEGTSIGALRIQAVQAYTNAVRERNFPQDNAEGYKMKSDEWRAFLQLVGEQS
ncbi:related to ECM31 - 3-methyl-2-oxobutanoate hydroxymethyltransferase [Ustilago trichophora]|uniref:3-methyl-2-oxobutanoate hydroxymethyltransferase n=1 Tax=Ustilago trichophora TaxID=86804 RepID=A0A5C3EJA0_9BASI|nr:related to ECM31 - 3-methyl-2-oxobutanoate hydroxymethyltransferase [Ustilago trichophora]